MPDVSAKLRTYPFPSGQNWIAYHVKIFMHPLSSDLSVRPDSCTPCSRVRGEMMEVKNIMIENIEKVLERGEKLDLLGECG